MSSSVAADFAFRIRSAFISQIVESPQNQHRCFVCKWSHTVGQKLSNTTPRPFGAAATASRGRGQNLLFIHCGPLTGKWLNQGFWTLISQSLIYQNMPDQHAWSDQDIPTFILSSGVTKYCSINIDAVITPLVSFYILKNVSTYKQ